MSKFKPCPYCKSGHEPWLLQSFPIKGVSYFNAGCVYCGYEIGGFTTEEGIIEAWNNQYYESIKEELKGLKIFYDNVNKMPRCEDCAKINSCEYARWGEQTRFNCPLFQEE